MSFGLLCHREEGVFQWGFYFIPLTLITFLMSVILLLASPYRSYLFPILTFTGMGLTIAVVFIGASMQYHSAWVLTVFLSLCYIIYLTVEAETPVIISSLLTLGLVGACFANFGVDKRQQPSSTRYVLVLLFLLVAFLRSTMAVPLGIWIGFFVSLVLESVAVPGAAERPSDTRATATNTTATTGTGPATTTTTATSTPATTTTQQQQPSLRTTQPLPYSSNLTTPPPAPTFPPSPVYVTNYPVSPVRRYTPTSSSTTSYPLRPAAAPGGSPSRYRGMGEVSSGYSGSSSSSTSNGGMRYRGTMPYTPFVPVEEVFTSRDEMMTRRYQASGRQSY